MRTATKEITLYSVSDLKQHPVVLKNVLDKQMDINVDNEIWHEHIIYNHIQKLKSLGFNDVEIRFRGFYSQGDGASFTCESIDFKKWLSENSTNNNKRLLSLLNKDLIGIDGNIKRDRNTHYYHWNTTTLHLDYNFYGNRNEFLNIENLITQLDEDITEFMQEYNREMYCELNNEYDTLISENCIMDYFEMIIESFIVGQQSQAIDQFKALPKSERKNMVKMAVGGNWLSGLNKNQIALLIDNI